MHEKCEWCSVRDPVRSRQLLFSCAARAALRQDGAVFRMCRDEDFVFGQRAVCRAPLSAGDSDNALRVAVAEWQSCHARP